MHDCDLLIIGAGPAGLIAAETAAKAGLAVEIYERMPTPARKLLMAGRGGLNLTHSEEFWRFLERYGASSPRLGAALAAFGPQSLRDWAGELGEPTFVGSSGRVFPKSFKASPLLRAFLARLDGLGVKLQRQRRWTGWTEDGGLAFTDAAGGSEIRRPRATLLALGGASWPRLGADGSWTGLLAERGVAVTPLAPANSGVAIAWGSYFRERHQGAPLKRIALGCAGSKVRGEALVTAYGLEGGAVYALGSRIRSALAREETPQLTIDLRPDLTIDELAGKLQRPRGTQSLSTFLAKVTKLPPIAVALLHEAAGKTLPAEPAALAALIKAVPLPISGLAGLERAISTAGGIAWDEIGTDFMLKRLPGVFVAGEMIDWEAPTGGYLLQASFATGVAAAKGALAFLEASGTAAQ